LSECFVVPPINGIQLVNDGQQAFGDLVGSDVLVAYSSISYPEDIIGNQSISETGIYYPAIPGTDPPSHFVLVTKDFTTDCTYFPVFGVFEGKFCMAWIENNPVGRVNLKYSDIPIVNTGAGGYPPPPGTPANPSVGSNKFYFYPNIKNFINQHFMDADFSQFQMLDIYGNIFDLDTTQSINRGVEIIMPGQISKLRFTLRMKLPSTIMKFQLTTAPSGQTGYVITPLSGVATTIYKKGDFNPYARVFTNSQGAFLVDLVNTEYIFEVEINNFNFSFNCDLI